MYQNTELFRSDNLKNSKEKIFDEDRFVSECLRDFADIRKRYEIEENLERVQQNPHMKQLVAEVVEGCTQEGILAMASREPGWKSRKVPHRWHPKWFLIQGLINGTAGPFDGVPVEGVVSSKTDAWIRHMKPVYAKKCEELHIKMECFKQFPEIIRDKEKQATNGDVRAMVFLGKVYEKGTLCSAKDEEKALSYMKQAREVYADDLSKRYTLWLDKTVQRSKMEMIGRIGKEYMMGILEKEGRINKDIKLRKEMRWLRRAAKAGDGWAAFTLGHICYYGYGRWRGHKSDAYNYYSLAASSKESVYALEMGNLCFDKHGAIDSEIEKMVLGFSQWVNADILSFGEREIFEEYSKIEDNSRNWFEENMIRDFLSEAKDAYKQGDYDSAWSLAQRAMFSGGQSLEAEGMLAEMVCKGAWKIDIDAMEEEPEITVQGEEAKATVCVKNVTGICETTAAIVAGIANRFSSEVKLKAGNHEIDAKSILMIEGFGLYKGRKVEILAKGKDAKAAVRCLAKLIINRFGEGA